MTPADKLREMIRKMERAAFIENATGREPPPWPAKPSR